MAGEEEEESALHFSELKLMRKKKSIENHCAGDQLASST